MYQVKSSNSAAWYIVPTLLRQYAVVWVCQTSVPNIAGFSSNQDSILGTARNLSKPSGRAKCPGTQILSRREDIRNLLGPFLAKIMMFGPLWGFSSKEQPLWSLVTIEKLRQLSWQHKRGTFFISSPERNMWCHYTHGTESKSWKNRVFESSGLWVWGGKLGLPLKIQN